MSNRSTATPRHHRIIHVLIAVAVLAGVGAVIWHKVVHDLVLPKNFGVVEEGRIYRSGQNSERVLRRMAEELGIRTIVDLGGDEGTPETRMERALADELGIRRYEFHLSGDGTGEPDRWAAALRIISDPDAHPLLLHCAAGSERSGTATLLYRALVDGATISQAYPETIEHDHDPKDWTLLAFVADHLPEIETAYRTDRPSDEGAGMSIAEFAETFLVNEGDEGTRD